MINNLDTLFPQLKNKKWKEVNLNKESKLFKGNLEDSYIFDKFVLGLNKKFNCDLTFGGFLENRSYLLRGHYNQKDKLFIHLGVDINVPAGTKVHSISDGEIFYIKKDPDQNGGWGGMVMVKVGKNYVIYGHLKQNFNFKVGKKIKMGDIIGEVAESLENGGWWPHTHIQMMTQEFVKKHDEKINPIDGYLKKSDPELKFILNPLKYNFLKSE